MSSTEAPFRATLPVEVMGHKILITAGGDTIGEYQMRWAEIADGAHVLLEMWQTIIAAVNAASLTQQPAQPPVAAVNDGGWNAAPPAATAPAAPPAAFQSAVAPVCAHGARNPVSKVGAKGPWKAYMCNAPQGGAKCEPIWIKRGTPEWDSFPA